MIFKSCFYDRRPPVITWHLTYFTLAVQEGLPLPCSAWHFILPFTFYGAQRAPDLQMRASLSLEAPDLCKSLLRKSVTSPCVVKACSCWCPSWHFCNPDWGLVALLVLELGCLLLQRTVNHIFHQILSKPGITNTRYGCERAITLWSYSPSTFMGA